MWGAPREQPDFALYDETMGVCVVADGMGGHHVAARSRATHVRKPTMRPARSKDGHRSQARSRVVLTTGAYDPARPPSVNGRQESGTWLQEHMGTTLIAALLHDKGIIDCQR